MKLKENEIYALTCEISKARKEAIDKKVENDKALKIKASKIYKQITLSYKQLNIFCDKTEVNKYLRITYNRGITLNYIYNLLISEEKNKLCNDAVIGTNYEIIRNKIIIACIEVSDLTDLYKKLSVKI